MFKSRNPHDFLEDIVTFVHSIYSCPNLFPTFNITSPNSPSLSHSPISSSCLPGHSHIPLSEQPGAFERLQLSPGLLRGDKIIKRRGSAVSTQDHWETQLNFTFFCKKSFQVTRGQGSHCAALPSFSRTADCPRFPLKRFVPRSARQVPAASTLVVVSGWMVKMKKTIIMERMVMVFRQTDVGCLHL